MLASSSRVLSRVSRRVSTNPFLLSPLTKRRISISSNQVHPSLFDSSHEVHSSNPVPLSSSLLQRFGFFSSTSSRFNEKKQEKSVKENDSKSTKSDEDAQASDKGETSDSGNEGELSMDDLVKLVAEKEELLELKHKHIEQLQDKVLRTYAEMENVMDRTRREAENSKKFAIQGFAKSLLDVSDNLERASSVVKESFSKIDVSKDTSGAAPLLKTLLEGVAMTKKQLLEVFKKYGVEKYDPANEKFDPNRHNAVFQVPDASKPSGMVASVLKPGYMLHDRVLRPAEVAVTKAVEDDA